MRQLCLCGASCLAHWCCPAVLQVANAKEAGAAGIIGTIGEVPDPSLPPLMPLPAMSGLQCWPFFGHTCVSSPYVGLPA